MLPPRKCNDPLHGQFVAMAPLHSDNACQPEATRELSATNLDRWPGAIGDQAPNTYRRQEQHRHHMSDFLALMRSRVDRNML